MIVLALDLATVTGYAVGCASEAPRSASVRLKDKGEDRPVAFSNFISWLEAKLKFERPILIVKEAPLKLGGFWAASNSEANVRIQFGLHAIAEGMAARFGISVRDVQAATVRKHFLGQSRFGDRESTKAAVVQRCHLLGLMPKHCFDDNRADALAIHFWACSVFGNTGNDKNLLLRDS